MAKRDPYSFGLGKRSPYSFGLGKKTGPLQLWIGQKGPLQFRSGQKEPLQLRPREVKQQTKFIFFVTCRPHQSLSEEVFLFRLKLSFSILLSQCNVNSVFLAVKLFP